VEGQRYSKRLNERQITALLKVTCQRPVERERDIMQVIDVLGLFCLFFLKLEWGVMFVFLPCGNFCLACKVYDSFLVSYCFSGVISVCIIQTVYHNAYHEDPYAQEFGIKISEKLAQVEARILPAPWVLLFNIKIY